MVSVPIDSDQLRVYLLSTGAGHTLSHKLCMHKDWTSLVQLHEGKDPIFKDPDFYIVAGRGLQFSSMRDYWLM
jgi:hypothetical protein